MENSGLLTNPHGVVSSSSFSHHFSLQLKSNLLQYNRRENGFEPIEEVFFFLLKFLISILFTFNPSWRKNTSHWNKNPHDSPVPSRCLFLCFPSRCVSRSPSLYHSSICLLSELYVVSHWNWEIKGANIWPEAQALTLRPANTLNTDMYNRPRSKLPLMVFGRYGRLSLCCLIGLQKSSLEGNKMSKGQTQCNYKSEDVTRTFVNDPLREGEDGGIYSHNIHIAVLLSTWTLRGRKRPCSHFTKRVELIGTTSKNVLSV